MTAALADHILQSTIFAALTALCMLLLRNNQARTRYWLWLVASLKFLIPFSLFVEIGHRITWHSAPVIVHPQVSIVVNEISRPFSALNFAPASPTIPVAAETLSTAASATAVPAPSTIPLLLAAVWLCGSVFVLVISIVRWRRVSATLRAALPLPQGRENEALRRLEHEAAINTPTKLVAAGSMEPGVFGILRPVLLLPQDISEHLNDAELDSILAHELCHIRRRDNMTAAMHMAVETIFWFHPLVWWIGRKLVDERERACDEDVVRMGTEPEIYAASILKICRFYLASPLACAAGVSGSDLRERIEIIMTNNPFLRTLSFGKKAALCTMATLAMLTPIAIGVLGAAAGRAQVHKSLPTPPPTLIAQASPPPLSSVTPPLPNPAPPPPAATANLPMFLSADVHVSPSTPNPVTRVSSAPGGRFEIRTAIMRDLIMLAYDVGEERVIGGPAWLADTRFDVIADAGPASTPDTHLLMLRALLRDRFGLVLHNDKRPIPVLTLTVGTGGTRMKQSVGSGDPTCERPTNGDPGFEAYSCRNMTMDRFPEVLHNWGGFAFWITPIVDQTNLKGAWDFTFKFTPRQQISAARTAGTDPIDIYAAVDKQLGLKLDLTKLPMDVLVIDRANEKPTPNPAGVSLPPAPTQFEVATVKPSDPSSTQSRMSAEPSGRVNIQGYTLQQLIMFAWDLSADRIANGPKFLDTDRFDIVARAFTNDPPSPVRSLDQDAIRIMMRSLLTARFKLTLHNEDRPVSAYVLTSAKTKLSPADQSNRSECQNVPTPGGGPRPRMMTCQNTTMTQFVDQLVRFAPGYFRGIPVLNETRIDGPWDLKLNFSPAQAFQTATGPNADGPADPNGALSIFDAIKEQLGLKLELLKRPVPVIVIDHLEQKPSDN